MIKAVIFDMDGVLVDSEPLWWQAEIEVLTSFGVPLTEAMCRQTVGMQIDKTVSYWHKRYPWGKSPTKDKTAKKITKKVKDLLKTKAEPIDGVVDLVDFFKQKDIKLALASSSEMKLIEVVVDKLKIRKYFDVIHSAEYEDHPKPAPDVYLTTAKKLKVKPRYCLVFEDSPVGVLSAKTAGMKCVATPEKALYNNKDIKKADLIISSFSLFPVMLWKKLLKL